MHARARLAWAIPPLLPTGTVGMYVRAKLTRVLKTMSRITQVISPIRAIVRDCSYSRNVPPRVVHAFGPCTRQAATPDCSQTSTQHNTTNMAPIDKAIEDLESRDYVDCHMYGEVALKYGYSRSTVSRRWRGVTRSKTTGDQEKQVIPPQQELELVQYITDLHVNGLAPTREMIQNFGSKVAGRAVSMSWVDRFLHRNHDHLTVR
jgi:hypothetical protein